MAHKIHVHTVIQGSIGKFPDQVKTEMLAYVTQFWLTSPSK
jgi:hypothetical protein